MNSSSHGHDRLTALVRSVAALQRIVSTRTAASLPASVVGCPGWFAADGARMLAEAAR